MARRPDKLALPIWMKLPFAVIIPLAVLPVFSELAGFGFLPSADWVAKTRMVSIAAGAATAVFACWFVARAARNIELQRPARTLAICIAVVLGFLLGKTALVIGVPALAAVANGQQTQLEFTVAAPGSSFGACSVPVYVAGLPFLFDHVCLTSDAGDFFQPGNRLLVQGQGTDMGVFVETLRAGN